MGLSSVVIHALIKSSQAYHNKLTVVLRHQMSPLQGNGAREKEGSYRKIQNTNLLVGMLVPGPFIARGSMEMSMLSVPASHKWSLTDASPDPVSGARL